jgi:hypothetical protein
MTPDEILTEIVSMGTGSSPDDLIDVIGAVIELHKPKDFYGDVICSQCWPMAELFSVEYPCPTIEAIIRELK